ncbi:MAG: hypothetical protein K6T31_10555, partial [Alicyclobacillus sp.]|nr:hypothetical protein [Alicyclobacillus sp.]
LWLQPVRIELGAGKRQGVLVHVSDATVSLVLSARELIHYAVDQIVNLSPVVDWMEPSADGAGEGLDGSLHTVRTGADESDHSKAVNSQGDGEAASGAPSTAQAAAQQAPTQDVSGRTSRPFSGVHDEPRNGHEQAETERLQASRLTLFGVRRESGLCRKGLVSGETPAVRAAVVRRYSARSRNGRDAVTGIRPWLPGAGVWR